MTYSRCSAAPAGERIDTDDGTAFYGAAIHMCGNKRNPETIADFGGDTLGVVVFPSSIPRPFCSAYTSGVGHLCPRRPPVFPCARLGSPAFLAVVRGRRCSLFPPSWSDSAVNTASSPATSLLSEDASCCAKHDTRQAMFSSSLGISKKCPSTDVTTCCPVPPTQKDWLRHHPLPKVMRLPPSPF